MLTINEEEKQIKNPSTLIAKSSPDTYKIAAAVTEKLDLNKAVVTAELIAPTISGSRTIASLNNAKRNKESRRLWCYPQKHPRLRFLDHKITPKTLKARQIEYSNILWDAYKADEIPTKTYTLKKGETLRQLSRSIVGTSDIWIELFLLNRSKISDWDNLPNGIQIKIPASNNLPVSCNGSVAQN